MTNRKNFSNQASVKEVEKRTHAQYLVVLECIKQIHHSSFPAPQFDDMLHDLSHGYASEMWEGEFEVDDAIAFTDSLKLLVRSGQTPIKKEELEERIQEILSIDTIQRLEDLLYFMMECFSTVSDKYKEGDLLPDMFFFGRIIKELLRECAKLTGHDKE